MAEGSNYVWQIGLWRPARSVLHGFWLPYRKDRGKNRFLREYRFNGQYTCGLLCDDLNEEEALERRQVQSRLAKEQEQGQYERDPR